MATFRPNPPIAGFSTNTGSFEGPRILVDALTNSTIPAFLIAGNATGSQFFISSSNFNIKANGNVTASNLTLTGGIIQTSTDPNRSRIIIDGFSNPATMTFYSASSDQFTLSSNISYYTPPTPSKGGVSYTLSCPPRATTNTGKGGIVLTNGMIFQGSFTSNILLENGTLKLTSGDEKQYTLDIQRSIDCVSNIDQNNETATANIVYYNRYTVNNGYNQNRIAVKASAYNGWSGSLGTYYAVYADASTNNSTYGAYSFYGAGGKMYNADEVIFAGGGTNSASLHLEGYNQRGGAGFHDYMLVNNTNATNPKKWHRISSTGTWEVVNSAYTTTIFSLTNAGVLSTPGGGTSDRRAKNNISYISEDTMPIINALRPASFEFNQYTGLTRHGFIAQDVLEVKPDLVLGDGSEEGGVYGLDYDGILALTVKALQEANQKIDSLEARIALLESGSV